MNVIEIDKLCVKYGEHVAVDNLNLDIKEGEVYGLLGPNGAGKSTTINILSGLNHDFHGNVTILGWNVNAKSSSLKQQLGVVPQDIAIYDDLTAYENVKFFASLYGVARKEIKERVEFALSFVGLTKHHNKYPHTFSGGMKRRLNIACSIAHQPKIVIMDEPTVGIDPQSRDCILESIKSLNKLGTTIIYTSHYMEEIEEICSLVSIMDHGKVICTSTVDDLKRQFNNKEIYKISTEKLTEEVQNEITKAFAKSDVIFEENTIQISSKLGSNSINSILTYLGSKNIGITDIEKVIPNFETVFLHLTGRNLRD